MTVFLRLLEARDKPEALRRALRDPGDGNRFEADTAHFSAVPRSPFAYWVSDRVRRLFRELPRFEGEGRTAKVGLQTSDDFRFVRAAWEVDPETIGKSWFPFAKGGKFSPFYADLHLVVNWRDDGAEIRNLLDRRSGRLLSRPQNPDYFFRPGLTWPRRTTSGLSCRLMPAGCVFADKGPGGFASDDDPSELLGLCGTLKSKAFGALMGLQLAAADAAARSYEVGVIQRTPVPRLDEAHRARLAALARRAWSLKRTVDTVNETSHAFVLPALLAVRRGAEAPIAEAIDGACAAAVVPRKTGAAEGKTLRGLARRFAGLVRRAEEELSRIKGEIDDICFELYGIEGEDRRAIERGFGKSRTKARANVTEQPIAPLVESLLSWCLGVAFGRFDARLATGERKPPAEPEPFDPLPVRSPGMLPLEAAASASSQPPCSLVDDRGHEFDLVSRVQSVFERIFGEEADAFWQEAAEILGDLRDWFSRSFFDRHLHGYSKSRRKAPIYWQLATASASYSVWLYYPGVTRDTLYRLQDQEIAEKLAHEERRLRDLRREVGENPSPAARQEIAARATLVAELRAFNTEIARAAPLFSPCRDDGVLLSFAPLHRLVPHHRAWQRQCREAFLAIVAGRYDWSHIAMGLYPERVVPKCAEDRSLALAHGLDEIFFEERDGKWRRRQVAADVVERLVSDRSSKAVKAALDALLSAPAPNGASRRKKASRAAGRRKAHAGAAVAAKQARSPQRHGRKSGLNEETLAKVRQAIASVAGGASKADVLAKTGLSAGDWNRAIALLLERGNVRREGERRGARYHIEGDRNA